MMQMGFKSRKNVIEDCYNLVFCNKRWNSETTQRKFLKKKIHRLTKQKLEKLSDPAKGTRS